ncbi:hypothetical protein PtB15_4B101 [Puccinia triticina]|nr:hypothetical protein PtB15_4B101 [Puccinia triticina]
MEEGNQHSKTDDYIYNGSKYLFDHGVPTINAQMQYEDNSDDQIWDGFDASRTFDNDLHDMEANKQAPLNPDADWQGVINNKLHNLSLAPAGNPHP